MPDVLLDRRRFLEGIETDPAIDALIVGGGIAGILAGASLRRAGVERIRIIDQAGGTIIFAALRAIGAGEEIFVRYNYPAAGQGGRLWFDIR